MERKKTDFPLGISTALMQSEETMSSYVGLTREQKREILTYSLISGQKGALRPVDADTQRDGFPER